MAMEDGGCPRDALAPRVGQGPREAGMWSRGWTDGMASPGEAVGAARAHERDGRADGRGHMGW